MSYLTVLNIRSFDDGRDRGPLVSTGDEVRPERELRLAVVMYGGVSLAIYINGVAQELLNLVRATAPNLDEPTRDAALYPDEQIEGSSTAIYREIARLPLRQDGATTNAGTSAIRQRVVIDIITGTSAGGINGIFLAKALANGQSLDGLGRMWEKEADLETLINDERSRNDLPQLPRTSRPRSLLNGRRMYARLKEAFDSMDEDQGAARGRLADELDLFVTTTDLHGRKVQLQVGKGEVAEERRYRKAFRLRVGGGKNDFTKQDNPFLAFIARCTSSFPFAFEPMQFSQAIEGCQGTNRTLDTSRWAHHFEDYGIVGTDGQIAAPNLARPYGDGGYLDNKPFSYAIDSIGVRSGGDTARVDRKLIFVDPDPERVLDERSRPSGQPIVPNAVENSLIALRLPAYETIREDLLRLNDRNRLVGKIQSVVLGVTDDFKRLARQRTRLADVLNDRERFVERDLNEIVALFGAAYGGYHRLKVSGLTDELAEIAANHLHIALESDEFRCLRALVRAWRDTCYSPNPAQEERSVYERPKKTEFAFLKEKDVSYRVRRLAFVNQQISRLSGADAKVLTETLDAPDVFGLDGAALEQPQRLAELLVHLHDLHGHLATTLRTLRGEREALFGRVEGGPKYAALRATIARHASAVKVFVGELKSVDGEREQRERATELLQRDGDVGMTAIRDIQQEIDEQVGRIAGAARGESERAIGKIDHADADVPVSFDLSEAARNIVRHYYAWFELYDAMICPISYGTEVGEEISTVEPVRISPLRGGAAAGLELNDSRQLPAGTSFGHFGDFLHAEWRANDILLGRLNAAEKLITMMLNGVPIQDTAAASYVRRAQAAIIAEEYGRLGSRTQHWMAKIPNARTAEDVLDEVTRNGMPREKICRENVLSWVSRSVRVAGKVFDDAADGPAAKKAANLVAQVGQVLSAVAEVAVPQRWWGLQLRRWVVRLWVYAVLLALSGAIFGSEEIRSFGLTVAGVLTVVGLVSILLRDWVRHEPWHRRAILPVLVVTAALAVFGAVQLWHVVLPWLAALSPRIMGICCN
jgi:patatin-related protein